MKKRIAVIDREKCHPIECGNYLCASLCPVNRTGADCITPGEDDTKARIDEVLCTGCSICPKRCPFGAITIINLPDTLKKSPVHRYGANMFELYSLPTPLFGKVTGIVGKNGLGKTTALKIIADLLKPNFGKFGEDVSFKDVIQYFKGTETQKFMEKVHNHEISFSYKPQQVDLIPKKFKGTVKELLKSVDTNGKLDDIAQQLNLHNFLDTDIAKVSGGELQRVAMAASVLKDANLYLFDEPTSYLDIKQRINISQFIQSLAKPDTAPLVIEHDLVILDHMTDLVNIMYGFEGVYGIVSGVKTTREGINAFLEGFLKEENVRFRDRAISFEKSDDRGGTQLQKLVAWKDIQTKLGKFSLKAHEGILHKNEIVGILGENGIGKTSFIKILAGVLKPDSGELDTEVRVAYKPQYLDTESDATVLEFLQDAVSQYHNQIIKPLSIEKLFSQKLTELSGGQLQRVAIAHCLSQDAELFLLDEPSAYVDVEQRLLISKVIKNIAEERNVTILVVDHDLMFLDYLSDRLIVFSGTSAKEGVLKGPFDMKEGMNMFLQDLGITLRRDVSSKRPRINKLGSVKDREQRENDSWYYG
ncbi:ribosome biogenesis/translation initiation ATPase RLI [Candidatus Woesearchaeota archaeon]|nr:ribosome biogenesis/translation initiation ATPase RLI [Candidatus Woesearchaeota archaeon]